MRLRLEQVVAVDPDRQQLREAVAVQLGLDVVAVAGRDEGQREAGACSRCSASAAPGRSSASSRPR